MAACKDELDGVALSQRDSICPRRYSTMCNHDKNKAQPRLTTLNTRIHVQTHTHKLFLSLTYRHAHTPHVERGCFIQQRFITEGRPQSWKNSKLGHEGKDWCVGLPQCCTCGLVCLSECRANQKCKS